MIKKIEIENYKSLENLSMELGRFNVLIGENGCGKTNILESLVFAAAGVNDRVENIFFAIRGGKPSEAHFFRSGFEMQNLKEEIKIAISNTENFRLALSFNNNNQPFSKWEHKRNFNDINLNIIPKTIYNDSRLREIKEYYDVLRAKIIESPSNGIAIEEIEKQINEFNELRQTFEEQRLLQTELIDGLFFISNYIIYAPENYFLRNIYATEIATEPVGYRGEGFLKFVKIIKKETPEQYKEIINHLHLIDWFEDFNVSEKDSFDESEFELSDKYLEDGLKSFDIRNANEGFLFVLFYLTIFISDYTPKFFAIDNIDTALNPKLCSKLISVLAELAKKHDKQVIITTHNPSVLDGLNLNDDEERLFVIARNKSGRTRATRIEKKPAVNGTAPVKLSEQFLRGYIGGLPKNF